MSRFASTDTPIIREAGVTLLLSARLGNRQSGPRSSYARGHQRASVTARLIAATTPTMTVMPANHKTLMRLASTRRISWVF